MTRQPIDETRPSTGELDPPATVSVRTSPAPRRSRSPEVAWCPACSWRQGRNGVSTDRPRTLPVQAFARLDGSDEPCAQSWDTTKTLTRSPALGITSATAINGEMREVRYMATHRARYGTVAIASDPRLAQAERRRPALPASAERLPRGATSARIVQGRGSWCPWRKAGVRPPRPPASLPPEVVTRAARGSASNASHPRPSPRQLGVFAGPATRPAGPPRGSPAPPYRARAPRRSAAGSGS